MTEKKIEAFAVCAMEDPDLVGVYVTELVERLCETEIGAEEIMEYYNGFPIEGKLRIVECVCRMTDKLRYAARVRGFRKRKA